VNNSRTSNTKASTSKNLKKIPKKSTSSTKNTNTSRKSSKNRNIQRRPNDLTTVYMPKKEEAKVVTKKVKVEKPKKEIDIEKLKKRAKNILLFSFLLAFVLTIGYLLFNMEIFLLKGIKVSGNEKYSDAEIISKSNLKIGKNVFLQLLDFNNNDIKLPYIAKSSLSLSFPNEFVINVKERYPSYVAYDSNKDTYYKLDNEGYILEETTLLQKGNDEILVEGFYFTEEIIFGNKIDEVYLSKIEVYKKIKEALKTGEINGEITKVSFINSLTTVTLDDKLTIIFQNDNNLKYKIGFLKGIIMDQGGIVDGKIDMSTENPVFSKFN